MTCSRLLGRGEAVRAAWARARCAGRTPQTDPRPRRAARRLSAACPRLSWGRCWPRWTASRARRASTRCGPRARAGRGRGQRARRRLAATSLVASMRCASAYAPKALPCTPMHALPRSCCATPLGPLPSSSSRRGKRRWRGRLCGWTWSRATRCPSPRAWCAGPALAWRGGVWRGLRARLDVDHARQPAPARHTQRAHTIRTHTQAGTLALEALALPRHATEAACAMGPLLGVTSMPDPTRCAWERGRGDAPRGRRRRCCSFAAAAAAL